MIRTQLKKTKTPGLPGQKNISSFFSSQNHQKALSSSTKLTGAALARTEPLTKDGETSAFRPHSPLKRSVLGDLENVLLSSPDLLCVPETPSSQIRLASPSSSRNPGRLSPQPSREVASLVELSQLSPICRSPRSKGQSARRVMTEEGRRTKWEEGCSVSVKRVISPPQESLNAKRPRNVNILAQRTALSPTGRNVKVAGPVIAILKTSHVSMDPSEGQSERSESHSRGTEVVFNDNTNYFGEQGKHQNKINEYETDSAFTVITEQKATEVKHTHPLIAHMHRPSAQTITPATKKSAKGGEIDRNNAGATVTADRNNAGATVTADRNNAGATVTADRNNAGATVTADRNNAGATVTADRNNAGATVTADRNNAGATVTADRNNAGATVTADRNNAGATVTADRNNAGATVTADRNNAGATVTADRNNAGATVTADRNNAGATVTADRNNAGATVTADRNNAGATVTADRNNAGATVTADRNNAGATVTADRNNAGATVTADRNNAGATVTADRNNAGATVTADRNNAGATVTADRNNAGATVTALTSLNEDGHNVTSSDQDRAAEKTGMTSSCPVEDMLDESWFAEQMDQSEGLVKDDKSKKLRKVPDHVILSGGLNNRYWVLDVDERPGLKTLTISCSKSLHPTETCLLKDGWDMTPVCCGDVVHLEGCSDGVSWVVGREQGFLVLLPDSLISGTSISNSIRCMRRAVLGDMFKSFDGGSKQMLNGTMVHEVFQRAATAKDFSLKTLSKMADQVLCRPQYLGDMYSLGVSQEEMKRELHDYLPSLELWAKEYLSSTTPKGISLKICQDSTTVVTVAELADIEENVWSPRFGLKGKIDVTARVQIQKPRSGSHRTSEERTVPLELKTGKESNSIEHRSQVILYTLMSSERYNSEAGLLLYLKTGNLHPVVASHMDRRELLKLRNTLVHHIHNCVEKEAKRNRLSKLPDILTDRQTCRYCPQKRNCALYKRAVDGSSADDCEDVVRDFLQQETGHLIPPQLSYFSHWLLLCGLEATSMEAKNGRKRVWLQTPEESEKNGSCVGNVQLSGPVTVQSDGVFLHRFHRSSMVPQEGLASSGLASGDRIVVSDQKGKLVGLATGYLCEVSKTSISCTLDRDLSKFSGVLFRLDGDEGVVGLSTHLTNLSRLMENSQDSDRLRELVVDLRPPEFIYNLSSVLPREAKDTVANILKGLNKPQKQAMKKVLLSKDYTLIVGMPGTGKTTTICTLVRILHACGFSVLLTSYTHSAVDNILLKLKRFRVGFLRLGQGQKVHPDILPYTEESARKKGVHTLSELEQLYNKELVVATTCMGIKHPIFTRRRFDFCIIDEASQISQPICLGPLFYAKRFVLVGDHQQLPPIVQNQEARSLGMDESLFKRLELHSEAVVQLNVQYRMNRQIMSLSNSLMYEGRLECGSERTATALLSLPFLLSVQSELSSYSKSHPQHDLAWIHATLLPSSPVCFLDCSMVPALESVEKGGISNHTEAALIHRLLSLLIKAGCKPSDIGVIAPYRQQLKSISALLQSSAFAGVEVNTVDRYQGRDKSLIVFSFVRSTAEDGNLGELLKDWRRLNVAITRAKHKLLMVGSITTLRRYAPVEKLLNHLQQENMIIQLPAAAHKALPSMFL